MSVPLRVLDFTYEQKYFFNFTFSHLEFYERYYNNRNLLYVISEFYWLFLFTFIEINRCKKIARGYSVFGNTLALQAYKAGSNPVASKEFIAQR